MKLRGIFKRGYLTKKRSMTVLNFQCKKCDGIFDCNVGKITFPIDSDRPAFTQEIICPKCGTLSIDEVLLTELGQSQLTEVHLAAID
jgi:rubredoxin